MIDVLKPIKCQQHEMYISIWTWGIFPTESVSLFKFTPNNKFVWVDLREQRDDFFLP